MSEYEQAYVTEAFLTNWVAPLGPHVDSFEREIADYLGVKGAVALSSGTAAIHLALNLLQVETNDIVFCSTLTFAASANPILYQKGIPVFIDSEPQSWNMSPLALERALREAKQMGKLPKAVIIVNLYGQSADMDPLLGLCNDYGVPVIEDAAESLGSTYKNKASGTFGKFGIFSFNGNKIITTSGGGMLVSNDQAALEKARFLATQARDPAKHYQHSQIGYNYRMSNILAAIGRGQLKVLNDRIRMRRDVFQRYYAALADTPGLKFMAEAAYGISNRWLTTLTIDYEQAGVTAIDVMDALASNNVESRPVWKPLHLQPVFREYKFYSHYKDRTVSNELFYSGVCLPSGSNMSINEQNRVISIIKNLLNDCKKEKGIYHNNI